MAYSGKFIRRSRSWKRGSDRPGRGHGARLGAFQATQPVSVWPGAGVAPSTRKRATPRSRAA